MVGGIGPSSALGMAQTGVAVVEDPAVPRLLFAFFLTCPDRFAAFAQAEFGQDVGECFAVEVFGLARFELSLV